MDMKVCSKCGRELILNDVYFFKDKKMKDGYFNSCKECNGARFVKKKENVAKEGYKICSKCNRELEASSKYFYKSSDCLYGLKSICKECTGHKFGEYAFTPINGYKICTECGENLPYTIEYYHSNGRGKGLSSSCKECRTKKSLSAYEVKKTDKEYAENANQRAKLWRLKSKGKDSYKETMRQKDQRRRALKNNLPATFTKKEWQECKKYFNNSCAYCGKLAPRLHQEHYIPLSKGGEYSKNNIVTACITCNSSKRDYMPDDWYPKQPFYSPEREQKILDYLGYKDGIQQISIL